MVMGLWSFNGPVTPPPGLADYGDTSRRLLRLGHIDFFGIGYLNLMLAAELPSLRLDEGPKRIAAGTIKFAMNVEISKAASTKSRTPYNQRRSISGPFARAST